jgi:hypothetical protein
MLAKQVSDHSSFNPSPLVSCVSDRASSRVPGLACTMVFYLCLLVAGITGMSHCAQPCSYFLIHFKVKLKSQVLWHMPVISALWR